MILGIESSCDESSLSLLDAESGLLREWTRSQIDLHSLYGGVVPDLASREHLENFPVLLDAMRADGFPLDPGSVQQIAVTCGPGLAGCLAMGVSLAKSAGFFLNAPVVGVNHLRAHAWSPFLPFLLQDPVGWREAVKAHLPHLGLLVSGGNTQLFVLDEDGGISVVAETLDDAAGEALDKGAKLLGLPYPGGPAVERIAEKGDPTRYAFPRLGRGRTRETGIFFSFSGLKTSLRYLLEKLDDAEVESGLADLCASYQEAVMDQLSARTAYCLEEMGESLRSVGLSGGVANNSVLRKRIRALATRSGLPCLLARPEHTGDNASMVAFAALADPQHLRTDGERMGIEPALDLAG